ncbi:MAG: dephospho-CoA kinase [Proteobacteria bacterium]|nr:dephospho-CoA kinase [Pseudomonadota bacterium]
MKIIGVTGPIASGKTTLSKRLSKLIKYPFWSADTCVHELMMHDAPIRQKIHSLFPIAFTKENDIDKNVLRACVLNDLENLKKLEKILHPAVEKSCRSFLQRARKNKLPGVILEIPLLFETRFEKEVDIIILIESLPSYQKKRILKRSKMTYEEAKIFEDRLIPLSEKRKKADIIIRNGFFIYWSLFKILLGILRLSKKKL